MTEIKVKEPKSITETHVNTVLTDNDKPCTGMVGPTGMIRGNLSPEDVVELRLQSLEKRVIFLEAFSKMYLESGCNHDN